MNINCLAIDDEPLALDVIADHAGKVPYLHLKGKTRNAFEAIELIEKGSVDLVFLDIQMPELTGFELLHSLTKKPLVVFTTAYPNFALESYEIDAVDYLVKPIPFNRFLKAVNKVKQRLSPSSSLVTIPSEVGNVEDSQEYIFVKSEYKTVKIFLHEIIFIESMKEYVAFHLKDRKVLSLLSLSSVEEALNREKFVRVHRSFIVALDKIDSLERNLIRLGNTSITVGENYRDLFHSIVEHKRI